MRSAPSDVRATAAGNAPALCEIAAQELKQEHNAGEDHGAGKRSTVDEIGEGHHQPPSKGRHTSPPVMQQ